MNRYYFLLISIGVLNLLVFGCLFSSFQNEKFYRNSIGLISQNYERPQESNQGEIIKSFKPYVELNNENILTWDASIYKCICERMYVAEYDCYGGVRAAFFRYFRYFGRSQIAMVSEFLLSTISYLLHQYRCWQSIC